MAEQRVVLEGDHVVFQSDNKTKSLQITKTRNVFFEKAKLKGEDIIGQRYGTLFQVQQGKVVVVTEAQNGQGAAADKTLESGKDNRDLVDSGKNQKLSQAEIMRMKKEGLSGQDIVGKLVAQSETFKTKTGFSQEKYIKKKKKKHMSVFRILQPTPRLLLDVFKHSPSRICHLRADSLSQLLCYSNVMSGSTVAVVESCQGLVLGSVMERMGGCGKVIHMYPGNDMTRHFVRFFNFPENHMETLLEFPLNKLASLENDSLFLPTETSGKNNATTGNSGETAATAMTVECSDNVSSQPAENKTVSESADVTMAVDEDSDSEPNVEEEEEKEEDEKGDAEKTKADADSDVLKKRKRGEQRKRGKHRSTPEEQAAQKQRRTERLLATATILREKNLDSLIIATKYDSVAVLMRLLPYVAPSRPVVVFSQHKEPLMDCFTQVKEQGWGVQLKLSESWYREYQVLPNRTHPLVNMSGTGGYLLSFIRVTSQQ